MIPLKSIRTENLTLLNLSQQGLYAEDLFILSQFLHSNNTITHLNLSKNKIGFACNNEAISSLGTETFGNSLCQSNRLEQLDLSENFLGPNNFRFF